MTTSEIITMLASAVDSQTETWADVGAGTGAFSVALTHLLQRGTIYMIDKSPHALWSLRSTDAVDLKIIEADFTKTMDFPKVDGMIMANALHYAQNHEEVLRNVISHLADGGIFILVEYQTSQSSKWVPYPVKYDDFVGLCERTDLLAPRLISTAPSTYGHQHIYCAVARKAHGSK